MKNKDDFSQTKESALNLTVDSPDSSDLTNFPAPEYGVSNDAFKGCSQLTVTVPPLPFFKDKVSSDINLSEDDLYGDLYGQTPTL